VDLHRREFVAMILGTVATVGLQGRAGAESDLLPSWNDGAAKSTILEFVRATTDASSPQFVPPEDRIAAFDQDGTLSVEHPMYTQVIYCFDRLPVVARAKPEMAGEEPFKPVFAGWENECVEPDARFSYRFQ
jgi:hypothetical protein